MSKPADKIIATLKGPPICLTCLAAKSELKPYVIVSELQGIARMVKFHSVAAICHACGVLAPIFQILD